MMGMGVANAEGWNNDDEGQDSAAAPPAGNPAPKEAPKEAQPPTNPPQQAPVVSPQPEGDGAKRDPSKPVNVEQEMLKKRRVFLTEAIDDKVAKRVCMELMFLDAEEPGTKIVMFINSPGGRVNAGLAIYDTMQAISSPVHTICFGKASSMAALILSAGEPGHRICMPHASVMVHQPSMEMPRMTATDVFIRADETRRVKELLNKIFALHTRQKQAVIEEALERDKHLTAEEAKRFGLVDRVSKTFDTSASSGQSKL